MSEHALATGRPALVAVAHGSRDPRSAATVRRLAEVVRTVDPALEVRVAFLDLSEPPLGEVLTRLHAEGHRHAVVVPMLLGSAYHARVDLPGVVADVTARLPHLHVSVADVLGADPALRAVALDRVVAAGAELADPRLGLVLSAVGSAHAPANAVVRDLAQRWHASYGCRVTAAFASAARPDVRAALATLRAHGATRFAVASWFLAPGLLPDRVREQARSSGAAVVADPLGADPRVARVVLRRYAEALTPGSVAPPARSA